MSYEPEPYDTDHAAAAQRTKLPGIFLIVIGVLNILAACYFLLLPGFQIRNIPPAEFERAKEQMTDVQKRQLEELQKQGWTLEELMSLMSRLFLGWGAVVVVAGLVTIFGGFQMMQHRAYGLAVAAAVLAAIPFLSLAGCCLLGIGIGIWALVVLFNSDVKATFS